MSVLIQEIKSHQLPEYRQFLAMGLQNDEENFRITVEDDLNAAFPTNDTKDSFTLAAYANDILAGVISFARDGVNRQKLRHKRIIFRINVSGEFRSQVLQNFSLLKCWNGCGCWKTLSR